MAIDTIKATAIFDGTVDTADLADDAVTTAKINAGAVDTTELADDAVTTAKIPDDAVTSAKLDTNIDIAGTLDVTGTTTADGNLLVGTTQHLQAANTTTADCGIALRNDAGIQASRDGQVSLYINRLTSDGAIQEFRKDGSAVGEIGCSGGTIYAGNGSSGVIFNDGGTKDLIPYSVTASDTVDDTINLGISSKRFKNLYLSGGAYLGGTGSANYLDDYEEGTFTPNITGSSAGTAGLYANPNGVYTKIGRTVICCIGMQINSVSGLSGQMRIGNLPFTSAGSSANGFFGNGIYLLDLASNPVGDIILQAVDNTDYFIVYEDNNTTNVHSGMNTTRLQAGTYVRGTIIYNAA